MGSVSEKRNREMLRRKAKKMFLAAAGEMTITAVADRLKLNRRTVMSWARNDNWSIDLKAQTGTGAKEGAPPGNHNARGSMTNGAPKGSANHLHSSVWAKGIPQELIHIMAQCCDLSTRDILWNHIQMLNAQIIYALNTFWVKYGDPDEKRLKKLEGEGVNLPMAVKPLGDIIKAQTEGGEARAALLIHKIEIETISQRDKQAQAMNSISTAMGELRKMVSEYESLYMNDDRVAEMRARIKKLDAECEKIKTPTTGEGIEAMKAIFQGMLGGAPPEDTQDGSTSNN